MQTTQDNTKTGDQNAKPGIEKIQYNIDGLEHDFGVEQEYCNFQDDPAVRIIFENGAMLQIRVPEGEKMLPVEESFKADDPHSVWTGGNELNGFDYSHCHSDVEKLVFASQADIDEYRKEYRKTEEDFSDWDNVQEVIF